MMTATETSTPTATETWDEQFAELKARYPKVREPILVALHILQGNPDVSLDDAKAQAALRGVRITAASVSGAQRLLSRQDDAPAQTPPARAATKTGATTPPKGRQRRTRPAPAAADPEALIRGVVEKLEARGNAEADRLRDAMRKAIATLQSAVGA